ncbi:glycosyltransferase family protein [Clostridium estertheticum]|uniref:hypothetical protein n=1 Tax=Clostridium estertheticum TaxID=238834 RepID=UPI001CF46D3D|nr:hypothetical protein [Clostridium estertheticum]MCB2340759.1 hypothetical protein [Clostridium estertheticum]
MFRIDQYKNKIDYSDLRWTLDTVEDFELIKTIYKLLYPRNKNNFNMNDILYLYKIHPEIKKVNIDIKQKLI